MLDSAAVQSSIWPLMRLPVLPQLLLHLQQSKLDADLAWVEWAHLVEFDVALSAKVLALRNSASAVETSTDLLSHCITELGEARLHGLIDHVATTQFFSPFNQLADARWLDLWARINLRREFVITLASQLAYPRLDELRLGTLLLGLIEIRTLAATDDVSFAVSPAPDGQSDPFSTQIGNLAELLGVPKKVADALHFLDEPLAQIISVHPLIKLLRSAVEAYPVAIFPSLPAVGSGLAEVAAILDLQPDLLLEANRRAIEAVMAAGRRFALPEAFLNLLAGRFDWPGWPFFSPSYLAVANDDVALKLASTLRDQALVKDLAAPWAWKLDENLQTLAAAVPQDLRLLAAVERFMLYLFDGDNLRLVPTAAQSDTTLFEEIRLSAGNGDSMVAHCLSERIAIGSWQWQEASLSLLDRQLIRQLGGTAIFCQPLMQGATPFALLVIGVDADSCELLASRALALRYYAQLLGRRLAAMQMRQERETMLQQELSGRTIKLLRELRHELGSPLSMAKNYLGIIALRFQHSGLARSDLLPIEDEIDRVVDLVESFVRRVGDDPAVELQTFDLNRLTRQLVLTFQEVDSARKSIRYQLDLDETNPQIRGDPLLLRQILTNLLDNAADASSSYGEITIATHGQVFVNGSQYVELTIRDQGEGIPAELLPQLFKPMSTRKAPPHQGLGLSIVKQLMDQLGGVLELRTSGNGTFWSLRFVRAL